MRRDKPEGAGRVASKTVYAAQGKSPDGENQRNRNRRMANMAPTPEIPTRMVAGSGTGLALDISGGEPAAAGTGAADNIPAARVKTVTITNDINVRRFIFLGLVFSTLIQENNRRQLTTRADNVKKQTCVSGWLTIPGPGAADPRRGTEGSRETGGAAWGEWADRFTA